MNHPDLRPSHVISYIETTSNRKKKWKRYRMAWEINQ